jgi:hypothetical protein
MKLPGVELQPEELRIVRGLLRQHLPDCEVWVLAFRVRRATKTYSDLDLAILGPIPLPLSTLANPLDDFFDPDLPFKMDIVDWATIPRGFRKTIEAERVVHKKPIQASQQDGVACV